MSIGSRIGASSSIMLLLSCDCGVSFMLKLYDEAKESAKSKSWFESYKKPPPTVDYLYNFSSMSSADSTLAMGMG